MKPQLCGKFLSASYHLNSGMWWLERLVFGRDVIAPGTRVRIVCTGRTVLARESPGLVFTVTEATFNSRYS